MTISTGGCAGAWSILHLDSLRLFSLQDSASISWMELGGRVRSVLPGIIISASESGRDRSQGEWVGGYDSAVMSLLYSALLNSHR